MKTKRKEKEKKKEEKKRKEAKRKGYVWSRIRDLRYTGTKLYH